MERDATNGGTRWIVADSRVDDARRLAAAVGVRPVVGQLLINRGVLRPEDAGRYLAPRLSELRTPDQMAGFAVAVARINRALVAHETIGIYGDYDVDGVTSCALLCTFLRRAGGHVVGRVAKRDAGYGFSPDEARAFSDAGCKVVVTCDCGTSDHEGLAEAHARGLEVIIVDHHQVPTKMPQALALINPHQPGCGFPFKGLASVGVAFYLAAALRTRMKLRGAPQLSHPKEAAALDPRELLDLVAIGTVADMAPLVDENRVLVRAGLMRLAQPARPGVRALCELAGLPGGVSRASDISMKLAPRLNAPGRLGAAQLSLDLLCAEDDATARALADACEAENKKRQEIQEGVFTQASAQAEALAPRARVLVVAGQGWHAGVVGIVAAKLLDRYARPTVVIALDGATGRGSARTVAGFHLVQAFDRAADLLVRYGGHAAAAGMTIASDRVDEFRARLESHADEIFGSAPQSRELSVDAELALDEIDEPLTAELQRLEPFGVGNPEPVFGVRGVFMERTRVVGSGHLQLTLRDGLHARDGIGFHLASGAPEVGARVRAAFVPEIDTWRGVRRLRVRVRDLQLDAEQAFVAGEQALVAVDQAIIGTELQVAITTEIAAATEVAVVVDAAG